MSHRLKSYFKKKMTFMLVPHDGGKSVQIKTNLFVIHTVVLVFGGLLTWAAMVIAQDVNYQLAQLTEQRFKSNMREILDELETNRVLLSRMASVDSQFRKLLKLGDRKKVFELDGMGGPTEEDSSTFLPSAPGKKRSFAEQGGRQPENLQPAGGPTRSQFQRDQRVSRTNKGPSWRPPPPFGRSRDGSPPVSAKGPRP